MEVSKDVVGKKPVPSRGASDLDVGMGSNAVSVGEKVIAFARTNPAVALVGSLLLGALVRKLVSRGT